MAKTLEQKFIENFRSICTGKTMEKSSEIVALMPNSSRTLARLRCLKTSLDAIYANSVFPPALCYSPQVVPYILNPELDKNVPHYITLYSSNSGSKFEVTIEDMLRLQPECEYIISGDFAKRGLEIYSELIRIDSFGPGDHLKNSTDYSKRQCKYVKLVPQPENSQPTVIPCPATRTDPIFGHKMRLFSWQDAVDITYGLALNGRKLESKLSPSLQKNLQRLQRRPDKRNWGWKHDGELIEFLSERSDSLYSGLKFGQITQFVEKIEVSSSIDYSEYAVANLTDENMNTYWESDEDRAHSEDGRATHYIRIYIKKNVVVDSLYISVDPADDSYMPSKVTVLGSESIFPHSWTTLETNNINTTIAGEVCVLNGNSSTFQIIQIRIDECKDEGLDTRVHGIRLKSKYEFFGDELREDIFADRTKWEAFSLLRNYESNKLYWRALALKRLVILLDLVLPHITPTMEPILNEGYKDLLSKARILMPLSRKRNALIDGIIKRSTSDTFRSMPKIYVNRSLARQPNATMEHSVFRQIYKELERMKQVEKMEIDYRWGSDFDQWWESVLIGEGVIDQGGGFRDTLADIGLELCPDDEITNPILPYFVRSRDNACWVPNIDCDDSDGYMWIGQLMGACARSKEALVLTLAAMVWRALICEQLDWDDYKQVDPLQFTSLSKLENCASKDEFDALMESFEADAVFNESEVILHNTTAVKVMEEQINFENRLQFVEKARGILLMQFDKQLKYLQNGIKSVLPIPLLQLLTCHCLERRVCGNPEINLDLLKKSVHYEDLDEDETRVKYLWNVLEKFTHAERSKFLRFVSGRCRLPAQLFISGEKADGVADSLPESSTCSNTLYLPTYTSEEILEEKLRYAVNHCVAIDADVQPWEE